MAKRRKKKKQQMCLFPGSNKPAVARGLSANYYAIALRQVKAGKVTWEELEAQGKALPPKGGCVVKDTPAQQWFSKDAKIDSNTVAKAQTKKPKVQENEEPKFMMVRNEETVEAEERNMLQRVHGEHNELLRSQLSRLTDLFATTHSLHKEIEAKIHETQNKFDEIRNG